MPVLDASSYQPPHLFQHAHISTIYPAIFRRIKKLNYQRETIFTSDDDFIDLDWARNDKQQLVVLVHGLEGSSESVYVRGMMRYFYDRNWDGLAINFRSCSGRINKQLRSYHMGASDDLGLIIQHALSKSYTKIALVGFSLGGNVVLKYLGEMGENISPKIIAGAAVSVPCHITSANKEFLLPKNRFYMWRFMRTLNAKAAQKARMFPDQIALPAEQPKGFKEFDDFFTAPVHGFRDAKHYWDVNSSIHFIPHIKVPSLLINAKNDTFLSPECFPEHLAKNSDLFHFMQPEFGGHCGFYPSKGEQDFWAEKQSFAFINRFA